MQQIPNNNTLITWFTQRQNRPFAVLGIAVVVMAILALAANGTGDDGDSVYHYLFARYAFAHPVNFFNHWAKPLFVMVASPFAQFGITGVKLLNVAFWGIQLYCTIEIGAHFGIKRLWLIPVFAIMAPMNVTHTLSGLTEPMFAAWFAMSTLLLLRGQYVAAYILFSFFPFVRSEGLIILCPLLLYALWRRHYLYILLFPVGHIVMSIAGKPIHNDYWWIFNKMTYRGLVSAYGSGPWDHFINNMPSVIGIALCLLLIAGLLYGFFKLIVGGQWFRDTFARDEAWLVFGMFLSYFVAHSIFWWKGLFNSFGLMRVMLGIMPAILLICLRGWNMLAAGFSIIHHRTVQVAQVLLLAGLAWSFFGRLSWDSFQMNAAQRSLYSASDAILQKFPNKSENVYYIEAYAAAIPLGLDVFDRYHTREARRLYSGEPVPPNSIVVCDDWFFPVEGEIALERLQRDKRLDLIGVFEGGSANGEKRHVSAFYVRPDAVEKDWSLEYTFDTLSESPKVVDIAGRKAVIVNNAQPYSPGLTSGLGSFPVEGSLQISFDAYCEKEGSQIPGLLILSAETGYQSYYWSKHGIQNNDLPANTWQNCKFIEKLPREKGDKDKVLIYFWNDSETPVYIDNFKIEQVSN